MLVTLDRHSEAFRRQTQNLLGFALAHLANLAQLTKSVAHIEPTVAVNSFNARVAHLVPFIVLLLMANVVGAPLLKSDLCVLSGLVDVVGRQKQCWQSTSLLGDVADCLDLLSVVTRRRDRWCAWDVPWAFLELMRVELCLGGDTSWLLLVLLHRGVCAAAEKRL